MKHQKSWRDLNPQPQTKKDYLAYIFLFIVSVILALAVSGALVVSVFLTGYYWRDFETTLKSVEVSKVEMIDVNSLSIPDQIRYIAEREHFDNPEYLIRVAFCESSLRPNAIGDGGQSRGLYQWHRPSNPQVSDKCALDVECSTIETIKKLKQGQARMWTCADKI